MQLVMWQKSLIDVAVDTGENKNMVQVMFNQGTLTYLDELYNMHYFNIENFRIHAPSEHTFDGKNFDLELQILH